MDWAISILCLISSILYLYSRFELNKLDELMNKWTNSINIKKEIHTEFCPRCGLGEIQYTQEEALKSDIYSCDCCNEILRLNPPEGEE